MIDDHETKRGCHGGSHRVFKPGRAASSYRAFAPTSNQESGSLFLIAREPNKYLILRFGGSITSEARIEGRRLLDMVSLPRWQRVEVIEEAPDGWDGDRDDVTSVTQITIREFRR